MTSSWMTVWLLALTVTVAVKAQDFRFGGSGLIKTYEGQVEPLFIEIIRSGLTDTDAHVTISAVEVTDNYSFQWAFQIDFAAGETTRVLPLGVIDDDVNQPDRVYIFTLSNATVGYVVVAPDSLIVSYIDNDDPNRFDCRAGGVCLNGGVCNAATGYCDCDNAVFTNCALLIENLDPTACASTFCGESGACVADQTTGTRCVCQPSYFGTTCEQKQYNVKCFTDRMCLNVDPPADYQGARYIKEYGGVAGCGLSDVTSAAITANDLPATWTGSYICLANEGSQCGDPFSEAESDGGTSLTRSALIRKNILITKYDILFSGTCRYNSKGEIYVDIGVDNDRFIGIFVSDTNFIVPAAVFVVDPDTRQRMTLTSVTVGQEICYAIVLEEGYSGIRLDGVIANDTQPNPLTYNVLSNGCPVPNTVSVVSRLPYLPDAANPRSVYFCLSAFSFDTSDRVGLRFQFTICSENNADCAPYTCGAEGPSYGRKKRQADDITEVLDTTYVVVPADESQSVSAQTQIGSEDSKLSTVVIIGLAVLAVLCMILLVVTIFLLIRSTRRRDRK